MQILVKSFQFLIILIFITSCKSLKDKFPLIKDNSESKKTDYINKVQQNKEVKISCGKGDITELLNEGWIISKEITEEKVCSWKSYPVNKFCDMDKDKGCKITKPDKMGEEKIYLLVK